ncbi:MAG TPA: hypothetical protein VGH38_36785 [Bryobacteraceae bacterium]|jgi:hypothetical protein
MPVNSEQPRRWLWLPVGALLLVNLVIASKLFSVEYSAYNGSIEYMFVAIPRIMAEHPFEWKWWPFWNGGLPFELSYLPFTHWLVAGFHLATGFSIARSFHIVTAAIYVLSALSVYWMALEVSRKPAASFVASLAYSCLSVSALLLRDIGVDAGGVLNLRRLQVLVFYGESPHTAALALTPVAVVCFSRALTGGAAKWKILAGAMAGAVVLSNAFGITILGLALVCWLLAFQPRPWWKALSTVAVIGVLSYCWISPWLSPTMIGAIRANAATNAGDFHYKRASWIALMAVASGFLLLWWAMRRLKARPHLQFFALFGYVPTAIVATWYLWKISFIPQPHRYQLEMDLALLLALVFLADAMVDRLPRRGRVVTLAVVLAALAAQSVHSVIYAQTLIRSGDPTRWSEYKIARWLDQNRHGERAYLSGSAAFLFNVFTDNPQFAGGAEQHTINPVIPVVNWAIVTGQNAGDRDAEYSIFWFKAFGTPSVSVSGPGSTDAYKSIVHPRKFEGVLPLLWRDGGDAIYDVPVRSRSLAHVIPSSAVVTRRPIHGLDIAPAEAYVAALEDSRYPLATFQWNSRSDATIHAAVERGQVISVQITYVKGWEAWSEGRRVSIRGDAIGQMIVEPDHAGPCEVSLRYTGGGEVLATRAMCLISMLAAGVYAWRLSSTSSTS